MKGLKKVLSSRPEQVDSLPRQGAHRVARVCRVAWVARLAKIASVASYVRGKEVVRLKIRMMPQNVHIVYEF